MKNALLAAAALLILATGYIFGDMHHPLSVVKVKSALRLTPIDREIQDQLKNIEYLNNQVAIESLENKVARLRAARYRSQGVINPFMAVNNP